MGIVFASYISLVNATREGTIFASMYPELRSSANDNHAYGANSTIWDEYNNRVSNEIWVVSGERLRAGQLLDQDLLTVDRPIVGATANPSDPITVTVHYRLHTFTSDISLPIFNRFGLPNYYQMDYTMSSPIR
jgi:hypothetical protein